MDNICLIGPKSNICTSIMSVDMYGVKKGDWCVEGLANDQTKRLIWIQATVSTFANPSDQLSITCVVSHSSYY